MDISRNSFYFQPYSFTMSRHDLSAVELRIMTAIIYKLKVAQFSDLQSIEEYIEADLFKTSDSSILIDFHSSDIMLAHKDKKGVKKNLKSLQARQIEININESFLLLNLIRKSFYNHRNGVFTVFLEKEIAAVLSNLGKNYTKAGILFSFLSQNRYSIRWYQIACHWLKKGSFEMKVIDIRKTLQVSSSLYPAAKEFNRRVIKSPIDEVNRKSDILITASPIKEGRNIVRWFFSVKSKDQTESTKQPPVAVDQKELFDQGFYSRKLDQFVIATKREQTAWKSVFEKHTNLDYDNYFGAMIKSFDSRKIQSVKGFVRSMSAYFATCIAKAEPIAKAELAEHFANEMKK